MVLSIRLTVGTDENRVLSDAKNKVAAKCEVEHSVTEPDDNGDDGSEIDDDNDVDVKDAPNDNETV